MAEAEFHCCSSEVRLVLDNEHFGAADFWEGYKLYCFAHYLKCGPSKAQFRVSKMGRVMCLLQNSSNVAWGAKFDEAIRQAWTEMEEYVQVRHKKDCTNLRGLMEEFDDVDKLSSSDNGCLLLQDDEHGTKHLLTKSLTVHVNTDIFDEIRGRLNQAQASLAQLSPRPHLAKCRKL